MDKILNLDSVDQYNSLYGLETLNPLVSVIDLNKATRQMDYVHWNYGVYALYLKLEKACDIKYGRRSYDYQEGTVVCFAPGQTTETTLTTDRVQLNVLGILFHPDLLYNPQIQISAESETKRSIFREKDKTKRSKKESAQHSKSRNKSFVMTSVSAL